MIDLRQIELTITNALERCLECKVIRSNQTAPVPAYPYCSYTITTPMTYNPGSYGVGGIFGDNTPRKQVGQIWSLTFQAADDIQSKTLAVRAHDFFDQEGRSALKDAGIVVQSMTNITNRDNILTVGYEYRNGFDITFALMSATGEDQDTGVIESIGVSPGETKI